MCIYIHMCICICICVYNIYIYIYIYVYIYIYIYILRHPFFPGTGCCSPREPPLMAAPIHREFTKGA